MNRSAVLRLSIGILGIASSSLGAAPLVVPLHFTSISPSETKLGIYVGIGGGAPQLFEFDTGGTGFYAAWAEQTATHSPWWGSLNVVNTSTSTYNRYDSGLTYSGTLSYAPVSLYRSLNPAELVTTLENAPVARSVDITKTAESGGDPEWYYWEGSKDPPSVGAPIEGQFYGDFGLGLKYDANGLQNLIASMSFGPGVTPGYRVHVDPQAEKAHLQIGLVAEDLTNPSGLYFQMQPDPGAPPGPYYAGQLLNADLRIQAMDGTINQWSDIGVTLDTGAVTTLHNTSGVIPEGLIKVDGEKARLEDGLGFSLLGIPEGKSIAEEFFSFSTTGTINDGRVKLDEQTGELYLNSGISLFYGYDVVYDLQGGRIGLIPVPEPSTALLLLLAVASAFLALRWAQRSRHRP